MLKKLALAAGAVSMAIAASSAQAQEWREEKPITLVVPFLPGAGNDLPGRFMADHLTPRLGQQVVVENRSGAGSMIGLDSVEGRAGRLYAAVVALGRHDHPSGRARNGALYRPRRF